MAAKQLRIEPFDRSRHVRENFHSGVEGVDSYLKLTAGKLAKAGNIRFFVLVDVAKPDEIIGFYTLNAHAVDYGELPKKYKRAAPGHGSIPAAFISMMGVDNRRQGEKIGAHLLADALKRIVIGSEAVATAVVLLDVINCGDAEQMKRRTQFYANFGFQALESQPTRLFLSVASIKASIQE